MLESIIILVAGVVAGSINSIAGGGSLISFPALIWLGRDPLLANATNTISIWPASLAAAWGFRRELMTSQRWLLLLMLPSIAGGALGAWLLLRTPAPTFERIVPFLILAATLLLAVQDVVTRRLGVIAQAHQRPAAGWVILVFAFQFLVSVYGGYFGAGMGILMLAALGLIGLTDMLQMNALKNALSVGINGVATIYFVLSAAVDWHDVILLSTGAVAGGLLGARFARRLGGGFVRRAVVAIGIVMTIALLIFR